MNLSDLYARSVGPVRDRVARMGEWNIMVPAEVRRGRPDADLPANCSDDDFNHLLRLKEKRKADREKVCPDFDNDCRYVKCPLSCWLGVHSGLGWAGGYCPLLRQEAGCE